MRPAFTQPSFQNLLVIAAGWLLTRGRHAVTESLVQTRVAGVRSHEIFHRFFSRASWAIDDMGKRVFLAVRAISGGGVRVVVDDTVARKKCTTGKLTFRAFLSSDVPMTVEQSLVAYSHRWTSRIFGQRRSALAYAGNPRASRPPAARVVLAAGRGGLGRAPEMATLESELPGSIPGEV